MRSLALGICYSLVSPLGLEVVEANFLTLGMRREAGQGMLPVLLD